MSKSDKDLEQYGEYIIMFFKGLYSFLKSVFYGLKRLREKKVYIFWLVFIIALSAGLFLMREKIFELVPKDNKKLQIGKYGIYGVPIFPFLYLYVLGQEHNKHLNSFDEVFDSIGFYGKGKRKERGIDGKLVEGKDYPKFMGITEEGPISIYSFYSNINISEWRNRIEDLQNALDCNILKMENAKTTKKVVMIHTVPSDMTIPEYIPWNDNLLIEDIEDKFELVVGENMLEKIKFNLNSFPHILIAGETGSGKSVILRLILWQAALKGAIIKMCDFKGGVEFGLDYERFGEVVTEKQRLLEILKELVVENAARLELFRKMRVKNISQYNNIARSKGLKELSRIIVFIDEVAEITDKQGASKEAKALIQQIDKEVSTLARLGRSPGINLVLGVQRPDANVVTGQIKNNIPIRICGRFSDKPASEIVLGNTRATNLPEVKGRFLYKLGADTLEFQAYYFDDDTMLKDIKSQTAGMLTKESEDKEESVETTRTNKKIYDSVLIEDEDVEGTQENSKSKYTQFNINEDEADQENDEVNIEVLGYDDLEDLEEEMPDMEPF